MKLDADVEACQFTDIFIFAFNEVLISIDYELLTELISYGETVIFFSTSCRVACNSLSRRNLIIRRMQQTYFALLYLLSRSLLGRTKPV